MLRPGWVSIRARRSIQVDLITAPVNVIKAWGIIRSVRAEIFPHVFRTGKKFRRFYVRVKRAALHLLKPIVVAHATRVFRRNLVPAHQEPNLLKCYVVLQKKLGADSYLMKIIEAN